MKRKEVLGAIYDYLWKNTDLNEKSLEKISNNLLDVIEEKGMLPSCNASLYDSNKDQWIDSYEWDIDA